MITIVDYGLGNILAFANMYKRMNVTVDVARSTDELKGASKIILPGVGSFDHAMHLLEASGMRPQLDEMVRGRQVPVLGICVGMQILAHGSDEGSRKGLGWIDGHVKALAKQSLPADLPLPHMGWNDVRPAPGQSLFKSMEGDARFYFLHSFYFECTRADDVAATANYGLDFACAVRHGNVHGVQFHPEKSHHWGANLLRNFAES
jgi:glutamine amidotransferase